MGTSINTGSDKQSYYKLSLSGSEQDSPHSMAETYFENGSMHGDLALVESSLSARAFINLVNMGVPFPRDEFGQFVGYKTDHDPRQRATSIGPYTSREMCLKLIGQVRSLGIAIRENRYAVQLITLNEEPKRIAGLIALNDKGEFEAYLCENFNIRSWRSRRSLSDECIPQCSHRGYRLGSDDRCSCPKPSGITIWSCLYEIPLECVWNLYAGYTPRNQPGIGWRFR